jgi:hypothetical protein
MRHKPGFVNTPEQQAKMPGILQRSASVSKAYKKWLAAGSPTRSDERVAEIYDQHCSQCPMLAETKLGQACKLCGCLLNRDRNFMNKLRWGTEACPDNPPRWVAEITVE